MTDAVLRGRDQARSRTEVSAAELREVVARQPTGVAVVTTMTQEPAGMTASSFTYISLSPATVLVCINDTNRVYAAILESGVYAVNLLGGSQAWLAQEFSIPGKSQRERFERVGFHTAVTGSPLIDDVSGWLDCRVSAVHEVGTHGIFVADVLAAGCDVWDEAPLIYHQRSMFPLGRTR